MQKLIYRSAIFVLSLLWIADATAQQLPQEWLRQFQAQGKTPDRTAAITTDAAGNIYVAGYSGAHHGAPDAFAMKCNPQGDTLWTYYYDSGTNNEDFATDIFVDNAGFVYITGNSQNSPSVSDCFTAKIQPSGTQVWATRYSAGATIESYGMSLAVDASGNVYVAGYQDPFSASTDWLVIKYNASGVQQWVDVLNGPGNGDDEAMDIVIAPNGNPTVCGFTYSVFASGAINAFIKQYTPTNGTAWTDTWSHPTHNGTDKFYGLGYNASGDLFAGGETYNVNNNESFAVRYSAAGVEQWATIYTDATSAVDEYLRDVKVDDAGNVYFTGTDFQNGYLTKINFDGTQGWRKKWTGPIAGGSDIFFELAFDGAGGVYTTGRGVYPGIPYYGNGGLPNMVITKYNSAGDSLWSYRCADSLNCSMGFAITYHNGKVYAGGFVTDTADIDENHYVIVVDTAGNQVTEKSLNGKGDGITKGQFVTTDASDNIYCGATIDRLYNNGMDVAVIKYNSAGILLWERYYSSYGLYDDTLTSMQLDPSGNLILGIGTEVSGSYLVSFVKMDAAGNFLDTTWMPLTGSTLITAMDIRNDGSVAATANSNINGGIVFSTDAALNFVWSQKIDTTQFALTRANSIDLFPNGDLVAGGYSQTATARYGVMHRINAAGTKLWTTLYDSLNAYDEIRDVSVDAAGDVLFTGSSGGNTTYATLVGKLNGVSGNELWHALYNPNTSYEWGVKVRGTPAGNVALISRGWTGSVARYYTVQYSGTGTFQWANTYSSTASDREPVDMLVEPSNRVVTAGWAINSFSINYDYVLTGYTSNGTLSFTNTFTNNQPVSSSWDQLRKLARDTQGALIVTGQSAQEFYNNWLYKMVTIKYGGSGVGLEEPVQAGASNVLVYPNPSATGQFTLISTSPNAIVSGKIYDMTGRYLFSIDPEAEQINLSNNPPGLYLLMLERKNEQAEMIKLMVR